MAHPPKRRIAVTGLGLVNPVGNDVDTTWSALLAGKSGAAPITNFDASGFSTTFGAEVKGFDPETAIPNRKLLKYASKSHRFASPPLTGSRRCGHRPRPRLIRTDGDSRSVRGCSRSITRISRWCTATPQPMEISTPTGSWIPSFPGIRSPSAAGSEWGQALLTKQFGIRGYASSVHTACASEARPSARR